uniref:RadC n=1 Tax=Bhargavaea cecembensis TaxID=394098 RepID=G3GCA2_9BACL|nr:RadC [Bhargavaea cecembensis]AEM62952.1 RadC [Bhargavaea cecembensis]
MTFDLYVPKISELHVADRPRERLIRQGAESLSNQELIAILLRTGTRQESVLQLANRVLAFFDKIQDLQHATLEEITSVKGIGEAKAVQLLAAVELGRRLSRKQSTERYVIRSPEDAAAYLMPDMASLQQENFVVLFLNVKNEVLHSSTIFIGSLNSSIVHPREVFREAVKRSAAAIIFGHIGMKNQWRNYNLLYPQCYINFAFFLMAKLSLKVVMSLLVLSTAGSHLVFTNNKVV